MPEIPYITHGDLLNLHFFSGGFSLAIIIGALYGVVRLIADVIALIRRRRRRNAQLDAEAQARRFRPQS